jgi:Kef-type K+ transport system membrane component KefB
MSSPDFVKFSLQITVMLAVAVFFGQIMRRFRQPAVLGEMIGGILLGPTLIGAAFPTFYGWLFNSSENVTVLREATIKLGMLFFLFIAGLEVDLSEFRRTGRRAAVIGLVGTLLPILAGVLLVYLLPRKFWGPAVQTHFFSFALFIGMNLANSANPVIARVLMDLGLLKGEIGSLIMTATVVDDLINWTLFALILSDIAPSGSARALPLPAMALMVIVFFVVVLLVGRKFGPPVLSWARQRIAWPTGFIAITALTILVLGSISESLGIHAFLGAFLAGAALGGSDREHHEAHEVIAVFVLSFFAPIYFVSMGMTANFVSHFDALLVSLILVAAYVSKIGAVLIGARLSGMRQNREVWAIGFGLNARGATGIILAGVGLAYNVIDERIFVAIAIMALVTSLTAGPALNALLPPRNLEIPAGVKGVPE